VGKMVSRKMNSWKQTRPKAVFGRQDMEGSSHENIKESSYSLFTG